jgi:ribonuclease HI
MKVCVYIDGGSRGNPGPAAAGVVVRDADNSRTLFEAGYILGRTTNNQAEYQGLIRALEDAARLGANELDIRSDSELLVRQLKGEYRVKSVDLKPLYERAVKLLDGFKAWRIKHVPREHNRRADELANRAMDAAADVALPAQPQTPAEPRDVSQTAGPSGPWCRVKLNGNPGSRCPARWDPAAVYAFGPTTPAGFCIYAAAPVLALLEHRPPASPSQPVRTRCPRCGVGIEIDP